MGRLYNITFSYLLLHPNYTGIFKCGLSSPATSLGYRARLMGVICNMFFLLFASVLPYTGRDICSLSSKEIDCILEKQVFAHTLSMLRF